MGPRIRLLACAAALARQASAFGDASSLVQAATGQRRTSTSVYDAPEGPMVTTPDGPILGVHEDSFDLFKNIPYAEPPKRFEKSVLKQAWHPRVVNATAYGPACIGADTSGPQGESEDCLTLNIWVPKGGREAMPVIVYFHGGMNQHGCGHEPLRQGDLIVQSQRRPTIFINFDFRLGIFGWIHAPEGSAVPHNLGFMDQQLLLRWVQRHISSFGGDPGSVTLMGQSEGGTNIYAHLAAPGSAGLFHRCVLASPPADVWSRSANKDRTVYMTQRLGCAGTTDTLQCLKNIPARTLWDADWVSEALAAPGSAKFMKSAMGMMGFTGMKGFDVHRVFASQGWHVAVDGATLPGEPRQLIAEGKWNKVPILITTTKNESVGVLPEFPPGGDQVLNMALRPLLGQNDLSHIKQRYRDTLKAAGITSVSNSDLGNQMLTDKLWMCDIRSFVQDVVRTGGVAHLGVFWHSPKFDRVGVRTNHKCVEGASCHATDMLYILPQGRGKGIHGEGMDGELDFASRYSEAMLDFVHGHDSQWVEFDADKQAVTIVDRSGPRVVPAYRREQCDVLDAASGPILPEFMRRRAA